jgi:hypothetical protein
MLQPALIAAVGQTIAPHLTTIHDNVKSFTNMKLHLAAGHTNYMSLFNGLTQYPALHPRAVAIHGQLTANRRAPVNFRIPGLDWGLDFRMPKELTKRFLMPLGWTEPESDLLTEISWTLSISPDTRNKYTNCGFFRAGKIGRGAGALSRVTGPNRIALCLNVYRYETEISLTHNL